MNKVKIIIAILAFSLMITGCAEIEELKNKKGGQPEEQFEVVNEPLEEDIATIADENNKEQSAHAFISDFHDFYNDTVCYGRVNSLDMVEQTEALDKILATIKVLKTNNADLRADFSTIAELAREIKENKSNSDSMNFILLHRYFHDLDIYFNGYDYSYAIGVTKYTR